MSRPYRILCLDGGGVRGALTTVILTRICQHHPNFLKDIDFICGTSAGGILSLMLASGYSAAECHEMYTFAAPHIFAHNPWRVINPTRARYSDKAKQELMQHYFGQRTMADLEMTCAAVAFRLDGRKSMTHSFFHREGWRPAVFSNMPLAEGLVAPDNDLLVWDAAMRTSAAPTYFPVYHGYTDGGVVANNPSILAVSKAMAHYPHVNTRNVAVLSIGAGSFPRHMNIFQQIHEERDAPLVIDGQIGGDFHGTNNKLHNTLAHNQQGLLAHADWGVKQWLPFLLDLLIDGESVTTEMVMHYLLAGNKMYHRLDPRLPKNFALDDVTLLQEIQDFAWTVDLTSTLDFVDNFFTYEEVLLLCVCTLYLLLLYSIMNHYSDVDCPIGAGQQHGTQFAGQREPLSRSLALRGLAAAYAAAAGRDGQSRSRVPHFCSPSPFFAFLYHCFCSFRVYSGGRDGCYSCGGGKSFQ